ncbi:MAG: BON domain-containing protein [Gemmatimonadaceae bacterium]|nr:BON domain-containing protein [Chitinophagaceae bacterium]
MKYLLLLAIPLAIVSCGPSDEKIQTEVNGKLTGGSVTASVSKGVVTLTGECPDDPCKTNSEASVKDLKGVKSVVNNISVAPPPVVQDAPVINPDAALTGLVSEVVKKYPGVKADVVDGVVTLTGTVRRANLQQLLQDVTDTKPKNTVNKLTIK